MKDYSGNAKVYIIDHLNKKHKAALRSFLPDSLYWTVEVNGDYTLTFTAYDDASEAYSLLTVQNIVQNFGEFFVIKQISDVKENGGTALQVTCSQVYTELSHHRVFGATASTGNNSGDLTTVKTSITLDSDGNAQASPSDILQYYVGDSNGNNGCSMAWQVHGEFDKKQIQFDATDVKSGITKITENWPDAVIFPVGYTIHIYKQSDFYQDHGHRIDYLHDTSQIQLDTDSTSIVNRVRAVGATYSKDQTGTADTGLPNGQITVSSGSQGAQRVIADAKKYLGVPYVWGGAGGARGGNPWGGMDCSSFVSQVYKDMGINIPAYTVSMEAYGHEISRSQVQTGDMGFYGSHGASYHICMALDNNTMIYEPAPGQSCKTQSINSYPPTWWERNDQMAKIVSSGSSSSASGGDDGTNATTETYSATDQYYFQPFIVEDKDSIARWGYFDGDDVTSDTITDPAVMKDYAMKQMKPNPTLSIQVTKIMNDRPILGDKIRLEIRPINYVTNVNLTGYTWYPYSRSTSSTINLNSNPKSILDYDSAFSKSFDRQNYVINGWSKEAWSKNEVRAFGENVENTENTTTKS